MAAKQPTIKQLHYFVCLAESLNFRQAASKLGISQPTLTAQISALEEALQLTLLERSRTGTFLSPQGRNCLNAAKQTLDAMQNFNAVAHTLRHGLAMTFKIGVPPTLGPYFLPFVFPWLHEKHEQLKLYVREAAPRQLEEKLISGELDLVLTPLPVLSSELSIEYLFTEPLKLVVPYDHPLADKDNVEPQDIFQEKVLTLEEHHHFHRQVQQICEQYGAFIQREFEGTSLDTLRQMVVMGLGIAFLPGLYVHSELHQPAALHVCEFEQVPIQREHALVWRNSSANRVFFRNLANDIREVINRELASVVITQQK